MTKNSGLSRTIVVLALALLTLLVVSLSVSKFVPTVQASPAYEDFTTYTEVDPTGLGSTVGHIRYTSNHVDFQDYRTEDAYLYKDKTAGHFTDFTHLVDSKRVSFVGNPQGYFWMLTNDIDDGNGLNTAAKTFLGAYFYCSGSGANRYLVIAENYAGSEYNQFYSYTLGTQYYLTIQKAGTALTMKIYNNAARTGLLATLSLTLHGNWNFRYIFAANTWNTGTANYYGDMDIDNLDLQELVTITLTTSPTGRNVRADSGTWYASPYAYSWTVGSSHSIEAQSPYTVVANQQQYIFAGWSDSGANPHSITVPASATTYTATMTQQWYITITSSGIGISGTVGGIDTVNSNGLPVNRLDAIKVTLNAPVVVTQISEYFITSLTTHIHMGIYTDSNGPGSLVSGSDTGQLTISSSQTLTYNYSTPIYLATGSYWLAYIHDLASGISYGGADSGVANTRFYATQTYGALPSTYPSGSSDTYSLNRGQLTSVSSDTTGTVATLGGNAKTQAQLPYSQWFNNGASCSYAFSSPVTATTLCEYYNTGDDGSDRAYGVVWLAQTFTVGASGHTVTSVKLKLYRLASPGLVTVSIRATDGTHPTGSDLASGTIDGNTLTTDIAGAWYEIALTAYPLSANTNYAIVVRDPSGSTSNKLYWRWDFSSPTYAGGNVENSADSGGTWTSYTSWDYMFEVWGTTTSTKQYVWSSTSGLSQTLQSNTFTVSTYGTITGAYLIQWQVTFAQTGLDSSASGTVVTVDETGVSYGSLSYSKWVYNGATVTYSYSPVSSSTVGKRFSLSSVSGSTSPITMTSATTVTGNYVVQWQVTITSSGISTDSSGTVATLGGNAKTQAQLPYSQWFNNGVSCSYAFTSPVTATSTKQYVWSSTSGLSQTLQSNTFTVSTYGTITGTYTIQYQITITSSGIADSSGTVATLDGDAKTQAQLPYSKWLTSGYSLTYSFTSPVASSSTKQYAWVSTSGLSQALQSNTFTVTGAGTITGAYAVQWQVTFTHSGLDSSAVGDVVTVDEAGVQYGSLPYSKWVYNGATVTYVYSDPVSSTPGKRFRLTEVTGPSSPATATSAVTVTGAYTIQVNRIIITACGMNNVVDTRTGGIVWYRAVYEWDNAPFTGSCGTLYLNGSAMTWATDRWTYAFLYQMSGSQTVFSITGVLDTQYGLTTIHNVAGDIVLNWATMEISIVKP